MVDSRLWKLSLQLLFLTLSLSTTIALSFLELAEDYFGHANVFHSCDMAIPAQLHLKQDGLYAGQVEQSDFSPLFLYRERQWLHP